MKRTINTLLIILFFSYCSISQGSDNPYTALGLGGIYNFQTKSFGADARLSIGITNRVAFLPRFSYYLPAGKINEYYAGADINFFINRKGSIRPYLLLGGYYNNWINNEQYQYGIGKKNNIVIEGGGGIIFDISCMIKPFIEFRYDAKWQEGSIGAGFMFSFQKCGNSGGTYRCPAYKTIYI